MQGPRYCYQLGEVGLPPIHSCSVSGHATRQFSQEGVSVQGIFVPVSGGGDLFSHTFVTTEANVATVAGPNGFP